MVSQSGGKAYTMNLKFIDESHAGSSPVSDTNWIAWAAGLFEGEGSIFWVQQMRRDKYYFYSRLSMNMTDQDVIRKFDTVLGCIGHVTFKASTIKNHKDKWCWQLTNKQDCKKVIELFWPYLGERRKAKAIEVGLHD